MSLFRRSHGFLYFWLADVRENPEVYSEGAAGYHIHLQKNKAWDYPSQVSEKKEEVCEEIYQTPVEKTLY